MPKSDLSSKVLSSRLSKRLASYKLKDAVIKSLAERVLVDGLSIGRIDPCIYGICIDYYTDKLPKLDTLAHKAGISKYEVFPYGIIDWDRFHVRIAFNVDEMQSQSAGAGFPGATFHG
jgi:hypothetical protein